MWLKERYNSVTGPTAAAKSGRPVFNEIMKRLMLGEGSVGLLIHKIDRGARNLRDLAAIGEAIELRRSKRRRSSR